MANKTAMMTFLFVAIGLITAVSAVKTKHLPNLHCSSRPAVVETKPHFYPYFVSLHRCNGSNGRRSPSLFKCVPTKTEDVKLKVSYGGLVKEITMKNHTECRSECVLTKEDCPSPGIYDSKSCNCHCPPDVPEELKTCPKGRSWSPLTCGCVCSHVTKCDKKYVFDHKTCSCQCNPKRKSRCEGNNGVFIADKCKCRKSQRQTSENSGQDDSFVGSTTFWIYILIGEFVLLAITFDLILFCKQMGLLFKITSSCRKNEDEPLPQKTPKSVEVHLNEACRSTFTSVNDVSQSSQMHYGEVRQL